MSGPSRRGLRVQEDHGALLGADFNPMLCVRGHHQVPASMPFAIRVEHRDGRCRDDHLDGMVGMGIGDAYRPGEGQHSRT
ncbi:hypothetical protein [Mycolicibacterium arseniciresistens]|uniref:hypothetical protein n=1 Tax=Mycolicibacterium arseniciresistens TaxID=3062257 RepID=UPI00389958E3